MNFQGEAYREEIYKYNTNIPVVGIAAWGAIKDREKLLVDNELKVCSFLFC